MAKNLNVLYGKKSIFERLKSNPASIRKVFVEEEFNDAVILELIAKHSIRSERAPSWKIRKIKPARNVQGITAKVEPFVYTPYKKLLQEHAAQGSSLIFLDGVDDPHNLGVIIRTLSCFGKFALIISSQGGCPINDTVMHVAIGGENYISAALVDDVCQAIREAKQQGITMVGSIPDATAQTIYTLDMPSSVGVVFGGEHKGIEPQILNLLDYTMHIPTPGADLSLNITIACAIVCNEIMRKKTIAQ